MNEKKKDKDNEKIKVETENICWFCGEKNCKRHSELELMFDTLEWE